MIKAEVMDSRWRARRSASRTPSPTLRSQRTEPVLTLSGINTLAGLLHDYEEIILSMIKLYTSGVNLSLANSLICRVTKITW